MYANTDLIKSINQWTFIPRAATSNGGVPALASDSTVREGDLKVG